jgi:hypothetical protein
MEMYRCCLDAVRICALGAGGVSSCLMTTRELLQGGTADLQSRRRVWRR